MNILFCSSEVTPFSSSGGLGDVIGSLPVAIANKNSDVKISVITPLYSFIDAKYRDKMEKVYDISFDLAWRAVGASVYKYSEKNVEYFFVENHNYFDRKNIYGETDDIERFAFFSKSVIEFILKSEDRFDILHANDWQTALAVIYIKTLYKENEVLKKIRTLFTIHNIEYQGKCKNEFAEDIFGIPKSNFNILEYDGCINLMKGAITVSDYISTVSPNYSYEIKYDFFSFGLSEIINNQSSKIGGVINGIDYSYFSPSNKEDIVFPFNKRTVKSGKSKNKEYIQKKLGLECKANTPLITMITRLVESKGIDLVLYIADELLRSEDIQLVVLGTGDRVYEERFASLEKQNKNFRALIKYDRKLSKELYAGADIFLMPSKREPCGLSQMIACAYGTVPIVRSVGGLYDTINPFDGSEGNGFVFKNYNAHELLYSIKKALLTYKNGTAWAKVRKNAIESDFSWSISAEKYIEIYKNLMSW